MLGQKTLLTISNLRNFSVYLFGATSVVINSDKEEYKCSGYRTTFNSACSRSFDNDFARKVLIFGADNCSSSHADNCKNSFVILGEGWRLELMEALVHQRKCLVLLSVKQTQNFAWVCIIMLITGICLLMEKKV